MAFRFKLAEPIEKGCKRIAREQIQRAQHQLEAGEDATVAVHETRKCLKRLRALLRLIRPAIGERAFRSENAHLRDIGGMLSGTRDRHVLIQTVAKLETASGHDGLGDAVRYLLSEQNGDQGDDVDAAAMKKALKELHEADKRLAKLQIAGSGFDVVARGLEASYRKARQAFRHAYELLDDEDFHEWRKGTQQHWRHMVLLSRAWPNCLGARINEARQLSQFLGDDHDLAILTAYIRSDRAALIPTEQANLIEEIARERQAELRALARPMGQRLFAEGPKALRRRMGAYWDAATADRALASSAKQAARDQQKASPPASEPRAHEPRSKKAKRNTAKTAKASGKSQQRRRRTEKSPA